MRITIRLHTKASPLVSLVPSLGLKLDSWSTVHNLLGLAGGGEYRLCSSPSCPVYRDLRQALHQEQTSRRAHRP
jgi:hypothetical protein